MGASLQTHYDTLDVDRHASAEQVRMAYRRKAQTCHPDKLPDQAQAQELMAQVNRAYAVLSDPPGRADYDRWLDARDDLLAAQQAVTAAAGPGARATWPWYLLSATLAFTMLSIGTVLYKELAVPIAVPLAPTGQGSGSATPAAGRESRPAVPRVPPSSTEPGRPAP